MTIEYISFEKAIFYSGYEIESHIINEIEKLRMNSFMEPVAIVIGKEYYMAYCESMFPDNYRFRVESDEAMTDANDPFLNDFRGIPFIIVRSPILEVIPDKKTIIRTEVS